MVPSTPPDWFGPLKWPVIEDPFCCRSRYFAEVVPFGSLQYKVHLPATFAGICCAGGCWANPTVPADRIKPKQSRKIRSQYLFTHPPSQPLYCRNLQQSAISFSFLREKIKSTSSRQTPRDQQRKRHTHAAPFNDSPFAARKSFHLRRRRRHTASQLRSPRATPIRWIHRPAAGGDGPHCRRLSPAVLRACQLNRHLPQRSVCLRPGGRDGRPPAHDTGAAIQLVPHRIPDHAHHFGHHLLAHGTRQAQP